MSNNRNLGNIANAITNATSGQVLTSQGSGVATFVDAATGGGGGSLEAVASGALANGDTVVVNTNGTVSAISGSVTENIGTQTDYDNGDTISSGYSSAVYDEANSKVVIFYRNESQNNYGYAVVGIISGTSISFGTPVVYESSQINLANRVKGLYIPALQKIIVLYSNSSSQARMKLGTVSGNSISFSSLTHPFSGGTISHVDMDYDAGTGNVILVKADGTLTFQVGSFSGSTISYTTAQTVSGQSGENPRIKSNGSGGILCVYSNSSVGTRAIALSLSGTTLTVPSSTTQIKNVGYYGLAVLEWIPLYSRFYFSGCFAQIQSWLLSISGTTATITSTGANPSLTPNYHTQGLGGTFFADTGEIYLFYQSPYNPSNLYARFRKVTLTSSTITYDSSSGTHGTMINTSFPIGSPTMWPYAIYAPDIKSAIILHSTSSNATGGSGTAVVINNTTTTNLTDENYIGISDAAYSNGQTATVQIAGSVDDAQSGLTAGQKYYVQYDGSLNVLAGSPSVVAGTAVSASKIIIKG